MSLSRLELGIEKAFLNRWVLWVRPRSIGSLGYRSGGVNKLMVTKILAALSVHNGRSLAFDDQQQPFKL